MVISSPTTSQAFLMKLKLYPSGHGTLKLPQSRIAPRISSSSIGASRRDLATSDYLRRHLFTKCNSEEKKRVGFIEININFSAISSWTMNGGEGPLSYANNSSYQKEGLDLANSLVQEEIIKKLDVKKLCSSNTFNIADLGCSVGENTLSAVENIIKAVKHRCQSQGISSEKLEYQVFLNDQISNDFNTLFHSLPLERVYFAAGVPGSFHGRLFPRSTLQFIYSSYAALWLSKIPEEVEDSRSQAWNKGMIFYQRKEVYEAYAAQFARDMESFLEARAQELQCGGFMALLIASEENERTRGRCTWSLALHLLGSCLMDLTTMGLLDESKVDSFNSPVYFSSPSELQALIQKSGFFRILKMEIWDRPVLDNTRSSINHFALGVRAISEMSIREHFGDEIVDQLFHRFGEKLIESDIFSDSTCPPTSDLFVLLERIDT